MKSHIITYDLGSTACKTCLYRVEDGLTLLASALSEYPLHFLPQGGVEQDPEDWWKAMMEGSRQVLQGSSLPKEEIAGISFCAQMQGLVLVDSQGQVLRPAMSYMDQRASAQQARVLHRGIQVEGMELRRLITSLSINGAVAASVKDPVWKYLWVKENEPQVFQKIHRWLDVKDYLIGRATGEWTMTRDSAFATFLSNEKSTPSRWSPTLMKLYGVQHEHLPRLVDATECIGNLSARAAEELGLSTKTRVFGGGGDAALIAVGAGAVDLGDCHVYTGTSGWVSLCIDKQDVDVKHHMAAIVGARPGHYLFFGEQETAGKCLEWVKNHLALDEINLYLEKTLVTQGWESKYLSLYDFLIAEIQQVPPGSGGVIFTPWLHGNRSPFEDAKSRGMFFNLQLETGKRMMIRSVVEGILFHQKWMFEAIQKRHPPRGPLRFVGGGARSNVVAQMMADIFNFPVQTIDDPQNAGAAGAAITTAIGLGLLGGFQEVRDFVQTKDNLEPNYRHQITYLKNYEVFKKLYRHNKKLFAELNS